MQEHRYGFAGLLLLLCIGSADAQTTRNDIVVGCPLPLTTSYGDNGRKGLILATEQINAKGGIWMGGKKYPVKLEFVDTGDLDPNVSQDAALAKLESLLTEKKVDVLIGGPTRSEYGLAAMDMIAKHDVVHIVASGCYTSKWNREKFPSDPKTYRKSFRISGDIAWYLHETKDLLEFLRKKYNFTKMFLLTQDTLMCRDAAKLVKKIAVENGWRIVGEESAPTETRDFRTYLTRCTRSGAQVLFLWNYSPNTSFLFEQWRTMEVPALPLGYVEAAEDPDFWKKTDGKCVFSVITLSEAGVTLSDVTSLSRDFYLAYQKRWGAPPRSTSCAACYEALFVLKDAAQRAASLKPDKLIPAMESIDLPVVRGQLRFDKQHQCVFGYDPKTSILGNWAQWQDGKRVTVWPPAGKMGDIKLPPWLNWWWPKMKKDSSSRGESNRRHAAGDPPIQSRAKIYK
ncbi:MAG: ABC transporter substrate-binding protein [Phycisphaerae bacterium]|nr:ABC transporter substrate-binding protein [Phycisphaerae bacterium]